MKKIKVAHIITKLELGGAQGNTLHTARNLDRNRFDVMLISGRGGILDEDALKIPDVSFYRVESLVRPVRPHKDIIALLRLVWILHKEKPDIVHTHSSKAGIIGRWAVWWINFRFQISDLRFFKRHNNLQSTIYNPKSIRLVHTYHGFGFNAYQKSITRFLFVVLEKLTALVTDVLIFVSEANLKEAKRLKIGDEKKYRIIRSGIDIKLYSDMKVNVQEKRAGMGIDADAKVITTIGPFKKQKNLSDFIIVSNLVRTRKSAKYKFIIIGDGEERPRLNVLAELLGLKDDVLFLGWLAPKDVAEVLKISDVFVMTSLWEGLPRAVLEAFASGVPVCANAVDGVKDVVISSKTGLLTEPFNTSGMADNVLKILDDKELRAQIVQNAKNVLDRSFDIDYMVRQQEEMYQQVENRE